MELDEVIYRVAHDFPGGVPKLARRMAMNAGTLQNKVNPGIETANLTAQEALAMTLATGDTRVLEAMNAAAGGFFVRQPEACGASDVELLELFLESDTADGTFAETVQRCLADGRITEREWGQIEGAGMARLQAFLTLMFRFRGMRDA